MQLAENWEDTSHNVEIGIYYIKELSSSTYGNATAKNLEDFVTKTLTSHGCYIGRYEAGDATAIEAARDKQSSDSNPITCKSGVYPYNYINQTTASDLCRNMYNNKNFESDLINSYVWDTAIMFIQKFSGDSNYYNQAGRNTARKIQKCGNSILDFDLDEGDVAQDVRCNIYDMAGNAHEWSTATAPNSRIGCCVYRGGNCGSNGASYAPYNWFISYDTDSSNGHLKTCRPILYL